jgi:hypothetical protein
MGRQGAFLNELFLKRLALAILWSILGLVYTAFRNVG